PRRWDGFTDDGEIVRNDKADLGLYRIFIDFFDHPFRRLTTRHSPKSAQALQFHPSRTISGPLPKAQNPLQSKLVPNARAEGTPCRTRLLWLIVAEGSSSPPAGSPFMTWFRTSRRGAPTTRSSAGSPV